VYEFKVSCATSWVDRFGWSLNLLYFAAQSKALILCLAGYDQGYKSLLKSEGLFNLEYSFRLDHVTSNTIKYNVKIMQNICFQYHVSLYKNQLSRVKYYQ
tara:strand:+ start:7827 stop:8126 length:300 start_codon:yes stop_codon:yes gene_type:complete